MYDCRFWDDQNKKVIRSKNVTFNKNLFYENLFCDGCFAQLKVMMLEMDCHVVGVKFDICENSCCDMSHEN